MSGRTRLYKYSGISLTKGIPSRSGVGRKILPPFLLPVVMVCYLFFGVGENDLLAILAMITLLLGCGLLWRPGEPPILAFVFAVQWLQASIFLFLGNWRGLNVDQLSSVGGDIERAVVLSLIGVLFLAIGMRFAAGRPFTPEVQLARRVVQEKSQTAFALLYGSAVIVAIVAQLVARIIPGLSQPLLALADFKWAAYFMFSFATFVRRDASRALWGAAFTIELALSLNGYFSTFKFVFLFTLLALVAAHVKVTAKRVIVAALFGAILLTFGLVWTAIKNEYRNFLNGGTGLQTVVVDYQQSLDELVDLVSALDERKLDLATDQLVRRIAYVDYFGVVLTTVPSFIPHEDGVLWLDALTRPFMPRLLFPNKAAIDASAMTNKYTGLGVAGQQQGTAISIGYMGESYIDFGEIGMMAPIFGLGLLLGWVNRWLMLHPNSRGILGMGLSTTILMSTASYLENSTANIIGGLVVSVLVAWLLLSYVVPLLFPSALK